MRPDVHIDALRRPALAKPPWLKVRLPGGGAFGAIIERMRALDLHTVCEEARCPNLAECWGGGTATMMVLGDTCTRACRFCHVKTGNPRGAVDPDEPEHVGDAVAAMGLRYVVLTSVDRDDLPDGGAAHFAACVRAVKRRDTRILVETLIPDFAGDEAALRTLCDAGPEVIAQNLETVERLTHTVRDRRAGYALTLDVLRAIKRIRPGAVTKSSLMLGLGETDDEVAGAMRDLRAAGVEILTLGQYLQPSLRHLPVERYVTPHEFDRHRALGERLGFRFVASGPLVRSSYRAGELFIESLLRERKNGDHPNA